MKLIWLALVALLAGCGAGGGGTAGSSVQPGELMVDVSTQAGTAATVLYAVEFTLHLPAGVTLVADPTSGEVAQGVLQPVDTAALAGARYLPAAAGVLASVKANIVDPVGVGAGPCVTLTCQVAPGASLSASGFSLDGFSARDANGAVIPGITPHFAVRTQ